MKNKLLLIVNPKSGKGAAKKHLYDLVRVFNEGGFDVTVYPTKDKNSTIRTVASSAGDYDRVVCCGGDGTLNEVISGIVSEGHSTPVGYIPMGTTNDFSNTLRLSHDPVQAAKDIVKGRVIRYDIGSFGDKYFTYIAATGAFTEASYATPQRLKNTVGHFAYVLEGAKDLIKIRPFKLKVSFDGNVLNGEYIYASVSNTTSVGGIVKLDKREVNTADGCFELILVKKPKDVADAVKLATDILTNRLNNNNVSLLHASKIKMRFDRAAAFTLDGEKGGEHKEIEIEDLRGALRLIVPSKQL